MGRAGCWGTYRGAIVGGALAAPYGPGIKVPAITRRLWRTGLLRVTLSLTACND